MGLCRSNHIVYNSTICYKIYLLIFFQKKTHNIKIYSNFAHVLNLVLRELCYHEKFIQPIHSDPVLS